MIGAFCYPEGDLNQEWIHEVRRVEARVEAGQAPSGVSPNHHLKFGRRGLADVEWTAQFLQLYHAWNHPVLRMVSTLEAFCAVAAASLLSDNEEQRLARSWELVSAFRDINVLTSGRTSSSRTDVLSHKIRGLITIATVPGRDVAIEHDIEEEYMCPARCIRADVKKVSLGVET